MFVNIVSVINSFVEGKKANLSAEEISKNILIAGDSKSTLGVFCNEEFLKKTIEDLHEHPGTAGVVNLVHTILYSKESLKHKSISSVLALERRISPAMYELYPGSFHVFIKELIAQYNEVIYGIKIGTANALIMPFSSHLDILKQKPIVMNIYLDNIVLVDIESIIMILSKGCNYNYGDWLYENDSSPNTRFMILRGFVALTTLQILDEIVEKYYGCLDESNLLNMLMTLQRRYVKIYNIYDANRIVIRGWNKILGDNNFAKIQNPLGYYANKEAIPWKVSKKNLPKK